MKTENNDNQTNLPEVKQQTGIVGLADKIDTIKEHFKSFEKLKDDLLTDNDYYKIKTKDHGEQKAIGKSGWYKFGVAFNISTFIIKEEKEWIDKEKGIFAYHLQMQATAPNGRSVQDVGSCDNTERDRKDASEHVVRAMAATRASERCMIKMVGAPEKASEDENASTEKVANGSKDCTCTLEARVITPDGRGCSNCKKSLSKIVIQELAK